MADFKGKARSNYFRVKDKAAFEAWADKRQVVFAYRGDGLATISPDNTRDGCWPDLEEDAETYWDIEVELAEHLAPKSIAVLMMIGSTNLRHLEGYACAIGEEGVLKRVSLDDVYSCPPEGHEMTDCAY